MKKIITLIVAIIVVALLIALGLLDVILIGLLSLLVLFFIILALLLFGPVNYECDGYLEDSRGVVNFKLSWFFKVLTAYYTYDTAMGKKDLLRVKFLWLNIYRSDNTKAKMKEAADETLDASIDETEEEVGESKTSKDGSVNSTKVFEDAKSAEEQISEKNAEKENIENKKMFEHFSEDDKQNSEKGHAKKEKKGFLNRLKAKINSIFERIQNIYETIKFVKDYPDRDLIIKYTYRLVKKLYKILKPKDFSAEGIFGFEDPADTGMALGALSILFTFARYKINIRGDFQKKVADFSFKLKGNFNLFQILVSLIYYVSRKPIFNLIIKYFIKGE